MGKLSRQIYHRRRIKSAKIRTFSAFLEKYFSLRMSLMSRGLDGATVLTVEIGSKASVANFLPDRDWHGEIRKNVEQKVVLRTKLDPGKHTRRLKSFGG